MVSVAKRTWIVFITSLICLGVVAILPFLTALAFALRPVLLLAMVVVIIVILVACLFGTSITASLPARGKLSVVRTRLRLPSDVMLHAKHVWVRVERGEELVVGIDDLIQSLLGTVQEVDTLPPGSHVQYDEPLFSLRSGSRCLSFRSPVSGTVLACNEDLLHRPRLINDKPYGAGWIIRFRGDDVHKDCQRLLRGSDAGSWFEEEVKCIEGLLARPAAVPSGEDQPTRQSDLGIDDASWARLTETVVTTDWRPTEPPTDGPVGHPNDDRGEST